MKRSFITLFTLFSFAILLFPTGKLSAQYVVGSCSGWTHSTLQDAFDDIMLSSSVGHITIDICPGTYVNQPASLGAVNYASSGGSITIRRASWGIGPVIFELTHDGILSALEFDGTQNVTVDNIGFKVNNSGSRIIFYLVALDNGAGEISFENCTFEGYTLSGSTTSWSNETGLTLCRINEQNGDVTFTNNHFFNAAAAISCELVQSGATDSDLWVEDNWFMENLTSGLSVRDGRDSIRFNNNHLESTNYADFYAGLRNNYEWTQYVEAKNNEITMSNMDKAIGIYTSPMYSELSSNDITGSKISQEFKGISLTDFTNETLIKQNDINYSAPALFSGAFSATATGIYFYADYTPQSGFPGTQEVVIKNNQINLSQQRNRNGIWLNCRGKQIQQKLGLSGNTIHFGNTRQIGGQAKGIFVDGHNVNVGTTNIMSNQITSSFLLAAPQVEGIVLREMDFHGPIKMFNNRIDLNKVANQSKGIFIEKITSAGIQKHYAGNNTIAFPTNDLSTHGFMLMDVNNLNLHHNSVNLYGNGEGNATSYALEISTSATGAGNNNGIWNNILSNPSGGRAFKIGDPSASITHDHNLLYTSPGSVLAEYGSVPVYGVGSWQTTSGGGANSLAGDPAFLGNTDLHIPNTSPAFEAAFDFTWPRHALTLNNDFEGDSRLGEPAGKREIGADELIHEWIPGKTHQSDETPSGMELFPNPTTGLATLQLPASQSEWSIVVMNMNGQVVLSKQVNNVTSTLDLSHEPAGVYMIQARNHNQLLQSKLIVK